MPGFTCCLLKSVLSTKFFLGQNGELFLSLLNFNDGTYVEGKLTSLLSALCGPSTWCRKSDV